MSKLEKYLAKATEPVVRKSEDVTINGDKWNVRQLTLSEERICFRQAEDANGNFDSYKYNDSRIVKATEHDFPWNDTELLKAYNAGTKNELPAKLFENDQAAYRELLVAVNHVNSNLKTEQELVDDLKNSSEQTEKQATSAELS